MKLLFMLAVVVLVVGCVTLNITVYFQPEQLDKAAEKSVERMWNLDGKPPETAPVTPAPEQPSK